MALPKMDWTHGDIPTHTEMQKYSDSLNEAYALLDPEKNRSYPAVYQGQMAELGDVPEPEVWAHLFVHRYRWLVYHGNTGVLRELSGEYPDVRFDTEAAEGWDVLDLQGIGWLVPGMFYVVEDIHAAMEVGTN